MGRLSLLAALMLLLVLAPVASAASSTDRAAARTFAAAAAKMSRLTDRSLPDSVVATQQSRLDCHLDAVRRAGAAGVPPKAIIQASLEGLAIARSIIYLTAVGPIEQFVERIDRVKTRDRRLRSGRAAWRAQLKSMLVYTKVPFPADICPRMEAWLASRGAKSAFADIEFGAALRELKASRAASSRETRIERAAERMRSLGQSSSRARRFEVSRAMARQLEVELEIVEPYGLSG